jgi:uncharacterized cupredoxin-like copper-binding protein
MPSRPISGALLILAGVLAGCRSDRPAADATPTADAAASPASTSTPAPAAEPAAVTVTATDYKLEVPSSMPAGAVAIHLVNHGKELHQAQIVRLEDGKTVADLEKAMKANGPLPSWMKFVGGPNGIAPGQETTTATSLAPGQYAALCLIPSPDGVPHLMKGMIQPFEVTAGDGGTALPAASDTVTMADYSFQSSRPLTSGHHTILVQNAGPQPHELVVLRLAPGKTVKDFATWATTGGMKGPPPAMPLGGVAVIENGASGVFSVDLPPGDYGLICFVPDAKDGKLHLEHGMTKQIRVG